MTKKVLFALAFAAVMLPASLRAQDPEPDPDPDPVVLGDTLFFTDFSDSAAWAESWTVTPYISDSTVIFARSTRGYNYIVLYGSTSSMTTPEITIPAEATDYSFICDLYGVSQGAAYGFVGGYEITIVDVNDPSNEVTLDDGTTDFADDDPGHRVVSLADWAGKTVQITFTFGNDEYLASYLMIYEVAIRKANKPWYYISAPSTALINQTYNLSAVRYEGDETNVTFEWTSVLGTLNNADDSNATISYTEGGVDTITLTVTNDYGTFTTSATIMAFSWSDIVSGCETPVDGYPYVQDFEDNENFECMKIYDADGDGFNWDIAGGKTHSGSYCATSASFDNDYGVLTPDNWLFLPPFILPNDVTDFTLSWWAIAQDSGWTHENYSVYVTEDPETFGTNPVYTGEPTGRYAQQKVSLEAYAGKTIYVAFRHYNCTDNFMLNIDDIVVGNIVGIQNAENAANVTIFPNPVCNVLNVEGENVKSVEVIDINGRVVLTNDRAGKLDMSEVAEGVYMVRVMSLSGVTTQKIVKK